MTKTYTFAAEEPNTLETHTIHVTAPSFPEAEAQANKVAREIKTEISGVADLRLYFEQVTVETSTD